MTRAAGRPARSSARSAAGSAAAAPRATLLGWNQPAVQDNFEYHETLGADLEGCYSKADAMHLRQIWPS